MGTCHTEESGRRAPARLHGDVQDSILSVARSHRHGWTSSMLVYAKSFPVLPSLSANTGQSGRQAQISGISRL